MELATHSTMPQENVKTTMNVLLVHITVMHWVQNTSVVTCRHEKIIIFYLYILTFRVLSDVRKRNAILARYWMKRDCA